jgi:hypothetical protein
VFRGNVPANWRVRNKNRLIGHSLDERPDPPILIAIPQMFALINCTRTIRETTYVVIFARFTGSTHDRPLLWARARPQGCSADRPRRSLARLVGAGTCHCASAKTHLRCRAGTHHKRRVTSSTPTRPAGSPGQGIPSSGDQHDCRRQSTAAGFLVKYNARFGREPHNPKNLHRPLSAGDDLDEGPKSGGFSTA